MLARVATTPSLRRVEGGFLAFSFGEHSTWLAILVYALQRGGPREVGIAAVALLVPGILLAPFAAYAGDRFAPHRALAVGYGTQCVAMAATAIAMAANEPPAVYVAAGLAATCVTFTRPIMGTLLPMITHAPSELVAANVVASLIEQIGLFVGPLAAGLLMAWRSPGLVFWVAAVALAVACVMTLLLDPVETEVRADPIGAREVVGEVFAGFTTLRRQPLLRALVALGAMAGLVKGVGDVIFVTFSDVRLDGGGGLPGLLAGAYGMGAIVGAALSARMVGRGRTSRTLLVAAGLAGAGLLALSAIDGIGPALVGFGILGAGEAVMGLAVFVTIQRSAPGRVLARVFGVLEGLQMAAIALGSLLVTVLVARTTMGVALVVLGVGVVGVVGVGVVRLRRFGADTVPVDDAIVERLLADPVLAPLAAPTIERLARGATSAEFPAGTVMVAEGELGDCYYLVVDGAAEVTVTGRHVSDLGDGDSFGEIALLRGTPRLATVRATTVTLTLVLGRDEFLEAVTGHPRSHRLASAKVDRHLTT
jgi:MFS family permease